jgi:hypothetical protein
MADKKSCASCAFCCQADQGYSEWTVTGATYTCLISLNPSFPMDNEEVPREPDQAKILEYADTCRAFLDGQRLIVGMGGQEEMRQEAIDWALQFRPSSPGKADKA